VIGPCCRGMATPCKTCLDVPKGHRELKRRDFFFAARAVRAETLIYEGKTMDWLFNDAAPVIAKILIS
jgi:hypothetical protein